MAMDMAYALHRIESDDLDQLAFNANAYSLFKHGSNEEARTLGKDLAQGFMTNANKLAVTENLVISVAHHAIATAAYTLCKHFTSYLNRYRISQRLDPAEYVDIYRTCPYGEDYAVQSPGGRRRLLSKSCFHIDTTRIRGKRVVVLDDIRVTGAHEYRITEMFRELGIVDDVHFVYFAIVQNPHVCSIIESHLNRAAISSIFDLERLIQSGHCVVNARLIKFMLGNLHEDFCRLIRRLKDSFLDELLDAAIAEGHGRNVNFEKNFRFLLWERQTRDELLDKPIS